MEIKEPTIKKSYVFASFEDFEKFRDAAFRAKIRGVEELSLTEVSNGWQPETFWFTHTPNIIVLGIGPRYIQILKGQKRVLWGPRETARTWSLYAPHKEQLKQMARFFQMPIPKSYIQWLSTYGEQPLAIPYKTVNGEYDIGWL